MDQAHVASTGLMEVERSPKWPQKSSIIRAKKFRLRTSKPPQPLVPQFRHATPLIGRQQTSLLGAGALRIREGSNLNGMLDDWRVNRDGLQVKLKHDEKRTYGSKTIWSVVF